MNLSSLNFIFPNKLIFCRIIAGLYVCLFVYLIVCNRGDTIRYWTGVDKLWRTTQLIYVHDCRYYGVSRRFLIIGVRFLSPRQTLSSHPPQQMVWLYRLQDRDSSPNTSQPSGLKKGEISGSSNMQPLESCLALGWTWALSTLSS